MVAPDPAPRGIQVISALGRTGPADLVVSYAHEDEDFVTDLRAHLAVLRRSNDIKWWYDREILAGADIDSEIDSQFEAADVVLFVVSAYFLNSDYCYGVEVQKAMQRHARSEAVVIPIIARPCQWDETPFSRLMALPRDGKPIESFTNRNDAYKDIADSLRRIIRQRKPKPVVSGNEFYSQSALVALRTNAIVQRPTAPLAANRLLLVAPDYVYANLVFIVYIAATDSGGVVRVPSGIEVVAHIDGGEFVASPDQGWAPTNEVLVFSLGEVTTLAVNARAYPNAAGRITVRAAGYSDATAEFVVVPTHDLKDTFPIFEGR